MFRIEKERELAQIKRQHEREIYLLRRKLHESTVRPVPVFENQPFDANVNIPSFKMSGAGGESHIEYVIQITAGSDAWSIQRRFRQFRMLSRHVGPVVRSRRPHDTLSVAKNLRQQIVTFSPRAKTTLTKIPEHVSPKL